MKNLFHSNWASVITVIIAFVTLTPAIGFSEEPPLFQIVASADSISDTKPFVGGAINVVTDQLGAPSAAWFNTKDDTLIDYIYVGTSKVLTFQVAKEGKIIGKVLSDPRSSWENGACRAYPKCPTRPA